MGSSAEVELELEVEAEVQVVPQLWLQQQLIEKRLVQLCS